VEIFPETERLVLRQFTEDDVDVLVQLDGDPDVMHFSYVFFQSSCFRPLPFAKPSSGREAVASKQAL
jgi:RimJ/RimL family protein N-acetyltransferase